MFNKKSWIFFLINALVVSSNAYATVLKEIEPKPFIVNGENAEELCGDQFPFHAHILIQNITGEPIRTSVGSGVLISSTVVLTLADNIFCHNHWRVGLGNLDLVSLDWHETDEYHIHDNYVPQSPTLLYNIGVLIFTTSLVNDYIRPIALPAQSVHNLPLVNEQGAISGFGHISQNPPQFADQLQVTFKRVVEWELCASLFPVPEQQFFCAQDFIHQSSFCGGDQGGPFVTFDFGKPVLTGLSLRMPNFDCSGINPGLFIRVEYFRDFIEQFI